MEAAARVLLARGAAPDITVAATHGLLVGGAREEKHERYRTEFRYGALHRAVTLPSTAYEDKISARYDNGILEVSVPLRAPEDEGRAIPVAKPS